MENRGGREPSDEGVRICLLGRFEVEWQGSALRAEEWTRQKAASVLQRLALERSLLKEQVIDELWPQASTDSGSNSLHQTLHLLRRTLDERFGAGSANLIFDFSGGVLRLHDSVRVDANEFESALASALTPAQLDSALAIYRGELLPAERYAEWTQQPRERLRQLHREAVWKQAGHRSALGEHTAALRLLLPLLDEDPADERVHRELIRLYAAAGRRHLALRQYQACREALADELSVEPGPDTEALYELLVRGELDPQPIGTAANHLRSAPAPGTEVALVGREAELAILRSRISEGSGGVLLIEGEAGVGKSRLANEALTSLVDSGAVVLLGCAYELEAQSSYQCFAEAFDDYLARTNGQRAIENPISHYRPLGVSDPQQEHSALFRSVLEFLSRLSSQGPALLLIDDLHAADEASIALFHYLARNARKNGLLLIGTYRRESKPSLKPFSRLLHSLYREGVAETLNVEPLSRQETAALMAALLRSEPDDDLISRVFESTEGNPFFVLELGRALGNPAALADRQRPGHLQIPDRLQSMLRERVWRLGERSAEFLSAAAVLGREFRFETVRAMVSSGYHELFRVLDDAITALVLEDTGDTYRFRHSLIRQALYDELSSGKRRWLHGLAAEAIRESYEGSAEGLEPHLETVAYHYARSTQRQPAIPYLLQAGEKAAAIYSLETADDYFRQALELLDEFGVDDRQVRWSIYFARGWWGLILARGPAALDSIERALALPIDDEWHPGEEALVRAHRIAARSLITAGNMDLAERHLEIASQLLTDRSSVDFADYNYDLALWLWHGGEHRQALETARRSMKIAEAAKDAGAQARALEMIALAAHALGDASEWQAAEARRSQLVGPHGDVMELFDIHLCLWEYRLFGEFDYPAIRQLVESTSRQARRMGAVRADALCHCFLGALEFQAGRWSRAESVLRLGIEMYRRIGAAAGEAHCCHRLAIVETARGNLDDALALLEDGIAAAERSLLRSHCLTRLYSVMIRNRLEAGDLPTADSALAAALSESRRHGNCNTCDSLLWPEAVSLRVRQRDLSAATSFCDELARAGERHGGPLWGAMISRARGELALAGGEAQEAVAHLEAACAGFEAVGFDFALARSLKQLATARSRDGIAESIGQARIDSVRADELLERLNRA